jgi:hypothetical protein
LPGILGQVTFSQTENFDLGIRDTVMLVITTAPVEGLSVPVTIEAWVYSDDTIVSFSSGFSWNNQKMKLDSATVSPLLKASSFGMYLFYRDHLDSSNSYQYFQLGGYTLGEGLPGYFQGRRKWATYYFTINHWTNADSIVIHMLPEHEVEYAFITPGPFSPVKYQPHFEGPLSFPEFATSIDEPQTVPSSFILHQNYPNPFNPGTTIQFGLHKKDYVELAVFDILGRKVTTLVDGIVSAGEHYVYWDGATATDKILPSGIYFYRLSSTGHTITRKMLLIK